MQTESNIDEKTLAQRAAQGDNRAMERLITANTGLVINVSKEYQGNGVDLDDLVSEATIALMIAIRKWNPEKTSRLMEYAVWDIRKALEKTVATVSNVIKVPEGEKNTYKSMDAPLRPGHSRSLGDTLTDGDHTPATDFTDTNSSTEMMLERLEFLNERERQVIESYYGIGRENMTMAEIAEEMGLKRERVRQIRKRAERRVRKLRTIQSPSKHSDPSKHSNS